MKKPRAYSVITIALLVAAVATAIVFGVPGIIHYADDTLGRLISDTVPRLAVGVVLLVFIAPTEYKKTLLPAPRTIPRALLWSLPCFAVAVVNFPFTAVIGGAATVDRTDLLWLFLLKCFSIAFMEELFFRAILVPVAVERFSGKYRLLFATLFTSAVFALVHLINLFYGASIGGTMLQVGYTFLIGCMLAVMLVKTENVWLCVAVHFIFDIGGTIITDLGHGAFQDLTFWILTAIVGVLCTGYIVEELIRFMKKTAPQNKENAQPEEP